MALCGTLHEGMAIEPAAGRGGRRPARGNGVQMYDGGKVEVSEEALELHRRSLVVDLHTDSLTAARMLGRDLSRRHRPPAGLRPWMLHADVPRMKEASLDAVFFGIVTHPWPHKAYQRALRNLRYGKFVIRKNSSAMALATSPDEIEAARAAGKIAVLFGLEGLHMLSGRLERIEEFFELGVSYVTLAHFSSNRFAVSSADKRRADVELGGRGAAAIELMNSLGMMIDLAHVHTNQIGEVCRMTTKPVIVSHGATQALRPTFRNLSDSDISDVAGTGGVIGLIYASEWLAKGPDVSIATVVDHADHIRQVAGVEHIALGSDFDGFIATPAGLRDVTDLPALTQLFLERGYSHDEVAGILGGNLMRVFREARSPA